MFDRTWLADWRNNSFANSRSSRSIESQPEDNFDDGDDDDGGVGDGDGDDDDAGNDDDVESMIFSGLWNLGTHQSSALLCLASNRVRTNKQNIKFNSLFNPCPISVDLHLFFKKVVDLGG